VVERGGLENRCGRFRPPWVRIPPPPLSRAERPVVAGLSCGSGYGRRDAALPLKTVQTAGRGCRMSLIVTVGRPWSPAGATNTAHRLPRVARVDRLRGAHELLGPKASYRPLLGELAEALVGEVTLRPRPREQVPVDARANPSRTHRHRPTPADVLGLNGVTALVAADSYARRDGWSLAIVKGPPQVQRVPEICGLTEALPLADEPLG
jgi:hypothetical protein